MHSNLKVILTTSLITAALAACQQTPFPTEPLHTANGAPDPRLHAIAAKNQQVFGMPSSDIPLPLSSVALLSPDVVGELQTQGLQDVPTANWEQPVPEEPYQEELPFKLGPGEYRLVFTPPNISYRALQDQVDIANAIALAQASNPQTVIIQQSVYQQPSFAPIYGGYISPLYGGYRPYAPYYGAYRGYPPLYGSPGYPRPIGSYPPGRFAGSYYGFARPLPVPYGPGAPVGGYAGGGYVGGGGYYSGGAPAPRFGPMSTPTPPGVIAPMGLPPVPSVPPGTIGR